MSLIRVYRRAHQEKLEEAKILRSTNSLKPIIENVEVETCFYVHLEKKRKLEITNEIAESIRWRLRPLLGDPWEENLGLANDSILEPSSSEENVLLEIGPRLNYSTPWSTNCVSICQASGLDEIDRLEKASRFLITFVPSLANDYRSQFIQSLFDPMTQEIYPEPLTKFPEHALPEKWTKVDILRRGRKALEEVNSSMGLAFDDWDLDYYTQLFQQKVGRNPTTVELFDLAQSNSEHSRHWFFKGCYEVDGEPLSKSLLDLVIDTNRPNTTNANSVIKFSDNSSAIVGWKVPCLIPSNPTTASHYKINDYLRHIIFTAETHNFPTGVSPFSGATTGTGGRIRDVQAAGRGGHVIAGTAGYCFGNLHIPGYKLEWEEEELYPLNFARPLEIAIEASNGASDYGNKFGEPVICGFSRSFGQHVGNSKSRERREWIKPIMFSGGIGSLDSKLVNKHPPELDQLVVKLGGPVYRIGVGGGAASSVQVQGDNAASRDLGAVQRGDAEMEQKLNRVIRACIEMNHNPILSIHDQGAGGNANVLKELVEGAGGVVFSKAFSLGDETLSTLEIWGAEYQESNAILTTSSHYQDLYLLAQRERCPIDKVGIITNDHKIRLFETDFTEVSEDDSLSDLPVNLDLDWVLGKMPRKVFKWTKQSVANIPLSIPSSETPVLALRRVLRLPSVASKRFLTNKVDRSVTGLVAQQQCVGPLQTPIADVAVTALSYFSVNGAATSIGEQPIKILVNPESGARVTVFEALSNMAACLITDIKDIKCSANWMWAAKLPGEGYALYQACKAMCDVMKKLGIAVDGGKDSLSMAARVSNPSREKSTVVKAPGSLVVSAYAPCPDVRKVVTPDLKSPCRKSKGTLLLIKPAFKYHRLGGSALAQVYSQIGAESPDVNGVQVVEFIAGFNAVQELIKRNLLLAIHDVSDGGLITCLIEMAIGGWGGIKVHLPKLEREENSEVPSVMSSLFNEEVGWVLEIDSDNLVEVLVTMDTYGLNQEISEIGTTSDCGPDSYITVSYAGETVVSLTVGEAATLWEETSFQLEKCQMNPDLAKEEFESLKSRKPFEYTINYKWSDILVCGPQLRHPETPRMAVIREEGSNGDRELAAAFLQAGFIVHDVTMSDLSTMSLNLDQFRGIAFPGGFSYADVLGSGVGWAASINERKSVRKALERWRTKKNTFSLGICNGCQLLALLGWVGVEGQQIPTVKLDLNNSGRYESRWSNVRIKKSKSILLKGMENSTLGVWVAHGEGRFTYKSEDTPQILEERSCISMQYVDDDGHPTDKYPFNPNGSADGVAGLTSECGRHLALMPHPERCFMSWQWPYTGAAQQWTTVGAPWSKLFQNAFDWCLKFSH